MRGVHEIERSPTWARGLLSNTKKLFAQAGLQFDGGQYIIASRDWQGRKQ